MKRSLLRSMILAAGLSAPLWGQAPAASPAPGAPHAAGHHEETTTELGEKMEAMGHAFKKLRGQVGDPGKNAASLVLVSTLHTNAEAAAKLEPEKTADLPAAERPKFKADFVAKMNSLLADLDKLEAALKAGNNQAAGQLVEAIGQTQKEGHQEFRKKKAEKRKA